MTKNLLFPAVHTNLYNFIAACRSKILLFLLGTNAILGFAQTERLERKGLLLNNPAEFNEAINLTSQKIIFGAFDNDTHTSTGGSSLWIADGTTISGPRMLKNFGKESDSTPFNVINMSTRFFKFNNKVFFNAGNSIDESINYLYTTDGTENGTFRLIDGKVAPSVYTVFHEKLYIGNNNELLTSDGTKTGTKRVGISPSLEIRNLFPLKELLIVETVSGLYAYNDQLKAFNYLADKRNTAVATRHFVFFVGKDGDLWRTNGTAEGTFSLNNLTDGADVIAPDRLMATSEYVAFKSYTDKTKNKTCLWISDGVNSDPMKDNKGKIVSTDTTGFIPLPTKFDEKLYFYLYNLDDITLASNNYLYVFHNSTTNAKFLKNITGFEGNLYPFEPKVNNNQEYMYGTPEDRFILDGDITIKGFNATTDSLITLMRIQTETPTSWIKSGNKVYFNKSYDNAIPGLYVRGVCTYDLVIITPDGTNICNGNPVGLNYFILQPSTPIAIFGAYFDYPKDDPRNAPDKMYTPGTYTVHLNDGLCTVSASVNITRSDSLSVSITGKTSFCPGEFIKLTAIPESGTAPYTYQWKNGSSNFDLNIDTVRVGMVGNYSVLVKDSKGCQGTAPFYSVIQKPLPDVRINKSNGTDILSGGSTILSVPASANQTYQWYKGTSTINGATKNTYTVTEAGKYSVLVNADGCYGSSEIVIINLILANESIEESIRIKVFPNPTDNLIKLNITEPLKKTAQISLLNMFGTVVKKWEIKQQESMLNLTDLPAGEYILQAVINNQSTSKKIIKL